MIIEVNGHKIEPRFNIGAFEEFQAITGVDILFSDATIDSKNLKVLSYVALKHGEGEGVDKLEDVDSLDVKVTLEVLTLFNGIFAKNGQDKKKAVKA